MKKYLKTALLLSTIATGSYADCAATACINVGITNVYVQADGETYIQTTGDESQLSCTAPAGAYVHLKSTSAGQKLMYSALLTAATTKSLITVQLVNGSPTCEISYISM